MPAILRSADAADSSLPRARPSRAPRVSGAATASLACLIRRGNRDTVLTSLGKRRISIDRGRHRDHKAKARKRSRPPDAA